MAETIKWDSMSLDDMYKAGYGDEKNKRKDRGGRRDGRGGKGRDRQRNFNSRDDDVEMDEGYGPERHNRGNRRQQRRNTPYKRAQPGSRAEPLPGGNIEGKWTNDLFGKEPEEEPKKERKNKSSEEIPLGTKVFVNNVHYEITDDDLTEVFSKFGEVMSVKIHYDRSGRSTERATVTFRKRASAEDSLEYNGRSIKGQDIEVSLEKARDRNDSRDNRNDNRRNNNNNRRNRDNRDRDQNRGGRSVYIDN